MSEQVTKRIAFQYGDPTTKKFTYKDLETGESFGFPVKIGVGSSGAIYEVKVKGEVISYNPKQLPVGVHENDAEAAEWRAKQIMIDARIKREKEQKEGLTKSRVNRLEKYLEPVRSAYRFADRKEQADLLAWVIQTITK